MEYWMIQAIISLVEAGVILGGIAAILKWSTFVTHREFKRQTEVCDKRFKELAAQDQSFKATLKSINRRLDHIEKSIDERFNALEKQIDNGGAK
jgi:flagellar capping protein FliD